MCPSLCFSWKLQVPGETRPQWAAVKLSAQSLAAAIKPHAHISREPPLAEAHSQSYFLSAAKIQPYVKQKSAPAIKYAQVLQKIKIKTETNPQTDISEFLEELGLIYDHYLLHLVH